LQRLLSWIVKPLFYLRNFSPCRHTLFVWLPCCPLTNAINSIIFRSQSNSVILLLEQKVASHTLQSYLCRLPTFHNLHIDYLSPKTYFYLILFSIPMSFHCYEDFSTFTLFDGIFISFLILD